MERLTKRELADVNGKQIVLCDHKEEDCNDSCMYGRCEWNRKALLKLKEYEDTDLTPERIEAMKGFANAVGNELAEYKEAEEQGLLLRLPCKVGDKFYFIQGAYDTVKKRFERKIFESTFGTLDLIIEYRKYVGKTVFLTKEEAEQALVRMKGENDES